MQSLFAQSHAINFQNEGRHAMEQNQPMNEGNVWMMDFWSATWHAANDLIITRICAVMAGQCLSAKKCWDSLQSRFWQSNHPHNRSQREFQNCGLKHHDHHNESLQWRLSVAHEASVLRKSGPVRGLTRNRKAKMNSFKTSQWRPSVKTFAETPSMWETDGVTSTSINDLTIHVTNAGNRTNKHADLAFPYLPPTHAISAFWTLLQAWPVPSLFPLRQRNIFQ